MIKKLLGVTLVSALAFAWPSLVATAQQTTPELNQLAKKLDDLGFKNCLTRINDISNFVVSQGQHSALLFFDEQKKDQTLVSFIVGRGGEDQNYLATLDFTQNTECSATYEITQIWIDSCEDVVASQFKDYAKGQTLHGGFSMMSKTENLHVAVRALPEAGCLTVQKEVIF